jgi:hypothetical protein
MKKMIFELAAVFAALSAPEYALAQQTGMYPNSDVHNNQQFDSGSKNARFYETGKLLSCGVLERTHRGVVFMGCEGEIEPILLIKYWEYEDKKRRELKAGQRATCKLLQNAAGSKVVADCWFKDVVRQPNSA